MEKFKVKKKHLTGEIADFPKRVVQAMVDEQVRQGNPANPSVFSIKCTAGKSQGGFNWMNAAPGFSWADIIRGKKFHLIPKREKPRSEGYSEGHSKGYDDGFSEGYDGGYDEGYAAGKSILEGDVESAYDEGYALGYSEGYSEGHS